jgi:uncharacterized protein YjiK
MKTQFHKEPPADFGKAALEYERAKLRSRQRTRKILLIAGAVCGLAILVFAIKGGIGQAFVNSSSSDKTLAANQPAEISGGIKVVKEWSMPDELTEISGLSYIDDDRMACVQDELGKVFIYNTTNEKVEKEIPFGAAGDYEGLAVVGKAIWVLRADGTIFEINDIDAPRPVVKEFDTHLTITEDCEGMCYDPDNNRLLVTVKEKDPNSDAYKGIYAFDLDNRTMAKEPVFKIDLQHELLATAATSGKKKKSGTIMPAAIAIDPISKDMFITDGPKSRLLVTDKAGTIKKLLQLDAKKFIQPEGITFNTKGELFISNEGKKVPGNILQIEFGSE